MKNNMRKVYQYNEDGRLVGEWESIVSAANEYDCDESAIRKACVKGRKTQGYYWGYLCKPDFFSQNSDDEIGILTKSNVKLEQSIQRERDFKSVKQRERKELYRFASKADEIIEALGEYKGKIDFSSHTFYDTSIYRDETDNVIIVQLSDLHLNELIDLPHNKYDFTIAGKRLKKYATEARRQIRAFNPKKVIVAFTGDLINSDRRVDEKIARATNRTKASVLAAKLLSQFILELSTEAKIEIISVVGNESRVKDDLALVDLEYTDNYDFLIVELLKMLLADSPINFIEGNPFETVLHINGKNILLTHGTFFGMKDSQRAMQQVIGKYGVKGIAIDYMIFGHIHFSSVTDFYARSGSLCGSNAYSTDVLQLATFAAQNLHIMKDDGDMQNLRITLQNTKNIEGYNVDKDADVYKAVSVSKHVPQYKVIKIN